MKNTEVAKLFAKAAGRCSICDLELFEDSVRLGEMAHMIAKSKRGPRGEELFDGDLNSYENLILLCPTDHTRVDGDPKKYPIEKLREIKARHEDRVRSMLNVPLKRQDDIAGLRVLMRFMPFTQIRSLIEFLPNSFRLRLLEVASALETFPLDNPHLRPFNDDLLEDRYGAFEAGFTKLMEAVDGYYHGSYGSEGNYYGLPDKDLPWEERAVVRRRIEQAAGRLIPVYVEFLNYLRTQYPEVDLSAYK
ncbi:HNH endonuclease signature motif containing protein [Burkholderia multivorans]|uniref:HNH endonuclease signature motif containing protein n=1 Tax=Burkholderia multivorans TaxID=87883 RepID=UPI000AD2AE79|nr:HNH endonuclease signature motif containing protein [Burkholderia multivorans]